MCCVDSFPRCKIGDKAVKALGECLRKWHTSTKDSFPVTHLDLSWCGVSETAAIAIGACLAGDPPRLTYLKLSGNRAITE
jgi:hypothetical protein